MGTVQVLAGDIAAGAWNIGFGAEGTMTRQGCDPVALSIAVTLDRLTEDKVKKLAGTAIWGAAGAVLLGPLGAIGGMMIGGNRKEIAFTATLRGGKKFMAKTDGKTFQKILAARFAMSQSS